MSKREQIRDAMASAISAISSLHVIDHAEHWEKVPKSDMDPIAAAVLDADETRIPAFIGDSGVTMEAKLTLSVTCYCYDQEDDFDILKGLRNDLMADIEEAAWAGTTLWSLVTSLDEIRIKTDWGLIPKYSVFSMEFGFSYYYDRTSP